MLFKLLFDTGLINKNQYEDYNINYFEAIQNVIKGQYPNIEGRELSALLLKVNAEALRMVTARDDSWAKDIALRHSTIELTTEECNSCKYHIDREILKQQRMILDGSMELSWKVLAKSIYSKEFHDVGMRVLYLSIQSADVERSCKAHGLIHTKVRNGLKNKRVQKLLYLYVNLRLLQKVYEPPQNFLTALIEDMQNQLSSINQDESNKEYL